jgi:endonuclease YncB( thermonuclease family)
MKPAVPLLGLTLLLAMAGSAVAADPDATLAALPEARRGVAAQIEDGATLRLDDGTGLRLAGIEPVLAAPGGNPHWEEAARRLLAALVTGRVVVLRGAAATPDRYDRQIGELVREDGLWIEAALVEAGAVRVQPPLPPDLAAALLAREAEARRKRLGLWQSPLYAVRTPHELAHDSGSYVVVEARIDRVENRHGVIWLELGEDAAARLDRPAHQLFTAAKQDPLAFAGQSLRLRGWVRWQGRPVLELAVPEAVETLEPHP